MSDKIVKVSVQPFKKLEADAIFGEVGALKASLFSDEVNKIAAEYGWEGLVEQFWNLRRRNDDFRWAACEVCTRLITAARDQLEANTELDNKQKRRTFGGVWRMLAKELGTTTMWVRLMVRTWLVFHDPGERDDNLSFSHHIYASGAEEPKEALALALGRQWNSQKLQYYLQGKELPTQEADVMSVHYDKMNKMLKDTPYPAITFNAFSDALQERHMDKAFIRWWNSREDKGEHLRPSSSGEAD